MRTFAIGTIVIALFAAACASSSSVDVDSIRQAGSPDSTPPVTTSPVVVSPPATSLVTTSPIATTPSTTSTAAPSDDSIVPSEDQDDGSESAESEPTVTTQPSKEIPAAPIQPVEPHPSGSAAAAIADLATRLSIDESAVMLVSQQEVTWPDGSLGCPSPDMSYTQVLVNGLLVVLDVDGRRFEYHSGAGSDLFYCAMPTGPTSGGVGDA